MKISFRSVVAVVVLSVSLLTGCNTGTAPMGESEALKELEAERVANFATIAALKKQVDELQAKVTPAVPNANLQTSTVSSNVATFHLPYAASSNCGQPCQPQQGNNLIVVQGTEAVQVLGRTRDVQAHICIVPPINFGAPAPEFIPPSAHQMQVPGVPAVPAVPHVPEQPMQQPMQPQNNAQPGGAQVRMMVGKNGQLVPCNHIQQ